MRILKASVLAAAVVALAAPALAGSGCGGYSQHEARTAQTVVTPDGPQTVVQTAEDKK